MNEPDHTDTPPPSPDGPRFVPDEADRWLKTRADVMRLVVERAADEPAAVPHPSEYLHAP